jgi:hypothetical protein
MMPGESSHYRSRSRGADSKTGGWTGKAGPHRQDRQLVEWRS